jgi:hypothetical protein
MNLAASCEPLDLSQAQFNEVCGCAQWTDKQRKLFGRVLANQLRVHSFPVRNNKQLLSSYNHAFALNEIYYHLLHDGNGSGTILSLII